jgi:anti-sigma regulatory factor (Ser/Thr protein kinase)
MQSLGQQKWQIPAEEAWIPEVLRAMEQCALAHGLASDECLRMQLAVEEALVNICHYAFDPPPPGTLYLEVVRLGQEFCVILEDEGRPFDPSSVPVPDLGSPLQERQVGGLGIHLIRQNACDFRYWRAGNRNHLELAFLAATPGQSR